MRLSATTAATRVSCALLAAMAISVAGTAGALAAKPSGGGSGGTGGTTGGKTRDTTPPTISISTPTSGSTVGSSQDTVAGSAADNVSVASVAVSVDGGSYQPASGTTSWSDVISSLSAGSHTITAKATDGAGNSATASVSVSVSSTGGGGGGSATPPVSTITQPRYDGAVVAGTYTLTGVSSDSTYSIAKVQWSVDGTAVASQTNVTQLSYAWDTTNVAQGSHTITYTTWNAAGASSSASRPITVGSATVKRVGVILYNFSDQTPTTTPAHVADWTFGTTRSVAGYYQEETYGRLVLGGQYSAAGDVFGFYTIPYTYAGASNCDFTDWEASATQQATAAGVNLNGYDVVMLTATVPPGCGSGIGGGVMDRVPWNSPATANDWIAFAGHELGHSFGVHHHAANWWCVDSAGNPVQVSSNCTSNEYGDPYDIMGSGSVQHMNAYELGEIGVLRSNNIETVTTSGTYTLAPLTAPATGVQTIRVARTRDASGNPTDFYYLEFRQPASYDVPPSGIVDYNGILVREAPDFSVGSVVSNLVDCTPGSVSGGDPYDAWDATLVPGHSFTDSSVRVTVTTVSVGSGGATVQISIG